MENFIKILILILFSQENNQMVALYKAEAESLLSPKHLPTSTELQRSENGQSEEQRK